jgi:hypothetical protein
MSTNEFWRENPNSFWAYRFSFINKQKRDAEKDNERAWLQGLYFYNAISISLSNMWCKDESKKQTYIKEPIDFSPKKIKSRDEIIKEKKIEVENDIRERMKKTQELLKKVGGKNG